MHALAYVRVSLFCLRAACVCLRVACVLLACCLRVACVLLACCLRVACVLLACWHRLRLHILLLNNHPYVCIDCKGRCVRQLARPLSSG
ncbi:hypothetical protein V1522DRAFT_402352 [Lipomyces starkeyi]